MEASRSQEKVFDLSGLAEAADLLRKTDDSAYNPMSSAQRALEGNKLSRVTYMATRKLSLFPNDVNPLEGKELPRDRAEAGKLILSSMLPAARIMVKDAITEYYEALTNIGKRSKAGVTTPKNIQQYVLESVLNFPLVSSSLELMQAHLVTRHQNSTKPERGQAQLVGAQVSLGLPVNAFTLFPFDVEVNDSCGQLAVGITCRAYQRLFYYHLVSDFMQSVGFIADHEAIAEKLMPSRIKRGTKEWQYADNLFEKCRKVHKLAIVLSEIEICGDKAMPYLLDYISKQCPGLDNFLKRNQLKQAGPATIEEKVILFDDHKHAQKQALHEKLLKYGAYAALGADEQHKIVRQLIHVTAAALTSEVMDDLFGKVIDPQKISAFARDPSGQNRKTEEKSQESGQGVVYGGEYFQVDDSNLPEGFLKPEQRQVFETVPLSHRTALIDNRAVTEHRKGIYSYQTDDAVVFFRFEGTDIRLLLAGDKSEVHSLAVKARRM